MEDINVTFKDLKYAFCPDFVHQLGPTENRSWWIRVGYLKLNQVAVPMWLLGQVSYFATVD